MGVTVLTDGELDRALSQRVSRSIPLPPELSLCDEAQATVLYDWLEFFELFGLEDHPVVSRLAHSKKRAAMASAIGHSASYLDRMSHYSAYIGHEDPVGVFDCRSAATEAVEDGEVVPSPANPSPRQGGPYPEADGSQREPDAQTAHARHPRPGRGAAACALCIDTAPSAIRRMAERYTTIFEGTDASPYAEEDEGFPTEEGPDSDSIAE